METPSKGFRLLRHGGDQPSRPGLYIKLPSGEVVHYWDGLLPGRRQDRYLRMPLPLALVVGPVAGGLFVLSFPIIGILLIAYTLWLRTTRATRTASQSLLSLLAVPDWLPGRSYLLRYLGRPKSPKASEKDGIEDELRKLVNRIEEKRGRRD